MPCHARFSPRPADSRLGIPFETAEDAWFWFVAAETARIDGARFEAACGSVARPCEPGDILRVVDRLYRNRLLLPDHLRVLRHYGLRFMPPDAARPRERRAAALWAQALDRLETSLVRKGIVATSESSLWEQSRHSGLGVGHA